MLTVYVAPESGVLHDLASIMCVLVAIAPEHSAVPRRFQPKRLINLGAYAELRWR